MDSKAESSVMPSVTTTAVHSRRNSFDLMSKQAEHMELSTKEAAREMEIKLQNQIRMNLARRLGEIEPAETPPTLVGSPRASFDSKDKNGWHDDLEKPTSQEHLEDGPPDGGFRAWLVVSGTFLMIMTNFGLLTSYGVFQSYYLNHQLSNLSQSTVSWIGSIQTFCIFLGSFVFGKLCDDRGPRWILIIGSILTFLSLLLVSLCKHFYQFVLAQGLLFGIGGSMLFLPSCAIVGQYFDKRRGLAMGIIMGAASFGGIVWPLVLSALFSSPKLGFEWGTRISALLLAILLSLSNVMMKPRLKSNSQSGSEAMPWTSFYQVFRNREYTIFVIGIFFMWINFFVPYFQISSYAKQAGFDSTMASRCIAIMNAASLVGRIGSGPIADRWGRFNCMAIFGFMSSLSLLLLWPMPGLKGTKAGVVLLSIFYGIFSGGSIAIASACCAQLSPQRELGTRLGMLWTSAAPGLLIGPVIASTLLSRFDDDYLSLALWAGFTTFLGTCVILLLRFRQTRGRWAVVV